MRTINIKVNNTNYEFICESRDTRYGLAHDCYLMIDCVEKSIAHCYYLNRTWERWTYQSVCCQAVYNLIESITDREKEFFKREHDYKKMTAKRKVEFEETLKHSKTLNDLNTVMKNLKDNLY